MFTVFALTTEERKDKNARVEELLSVIADGDANAVGELYEIIKTDVFAFALSKTCDKADAEDVTQDTFVQIYKNAKQYVPKGKPMAWIMTVEINIIRGKWRQEKKISPLDEGFENTPSAENVEEKIVNNAFLVKILSGLSGEEREIISLHIVSGLKHREIAKILGKPLSTILSRYNRAIKKLKQAQKEEKGE